MSLNLASKTTTIASLHKTVIVIIINTKTVKFIYHKDFCLQLDHLDQILFDQERCSAFLVKELPAKMPVVKWRHGSSGHKGLTIMLKQKHHLQII